MKKILLLGSGELGKEFVIAAKRAGAYVVACDRYNDAPAMQVADEREVFSMLDGDALEAAVKKRQPDIITDSLSYTASPTASSYVVIWKRAPSIGA